MKKANPKGKWIRNIVLFVLLGALLCVLAVVGYLAVQYHTTYEPIDIVERPDSFVMPEYPGLDEVPPEEGETEPALDTDWPGAETTEAPQATTEIVTETEPAETTIPETTAPVTAPVETTAAETTTAVPETVPSIVTQPAVSTGTAPSETNAPAVTAKPAVTTAAKNKKPGKWSVFIRDPIYKVERIHSDIINILLLGIDTRDVDLDRGRSDAMIVLSYNTKTGSIKLLSFLRDSLVPIEGHDWNRLNTAYSFGGAGMAVNTFNQLWGLDIQQYVAVDFTGIRSILDLIGPLELNLTKAEAELYYRHGAKHLKEGLNSMNTEDVMRHLSNRSSDNDFGWTRRQRDVVIAIAQKLLKEKSLTEILAITEKVAGIVNTNIDMTTLVSLATSVVAQKDNLAIETSSIPFSDAYVFGWYKKMAILSFDIQSTADRVQKILYGE